MCTTPAQVGNVWRSLEAGSIDSKGGKNSESLKQSTLQKPTLLNVTSGSTCTSEESYKRFITKAQKEELLFEKVKKYCRVKPTLLQKIVKWGLSEFPNLKAVEKTTEELSNGRIWVSASLDQSDGSFDQQGQDFMDDMKGAYQELEAGIYYQPRPQRNELGVQHRIRKSLLNLWVIEENDKNDAWIPCAKESQGGEWVDLKNSRRMIKVQLVPILKVLEKMRSEEEIHDVEKYLDFLFTACNQRKLINKLKSRNLKHNIANLRLKLQKQYALNFSIKVAQAADAIALELEDS